MSRPAVDHRRATAERNAAAILDAAERLLARGTAVSMVAIAGEAGVSRPTLYSHYPTLADVVEAAAARAVRSALAAVRAAQPEDGPADAALLRVVEASWSTLGRFQALAGAVDVHLSPEAGHRAHAEMIKPLLALAQRGQEDGAFRTDVPAPWLVRMYFAVVHGADGFARGRGEARDDTLELLKRTILSVFGADESSSPPPGGGGPAPSPVRVP